MAVSGDRLLDSVDLNGDWLLVQRMGKVKQPKLDRRQRSSSHLKQSAGQMRMCPGFPTRLAAGGAADSNMERLGSGAPVSSLKPVATNQDRRVVRARRHALCDSDGG